jgi:hypothetical protein
MTRPSDWSTAFSTPSLTVPPRPTPRRLPIALERSVQVTPPTGRLQLLDQIWLSPTAAGTLTGAGIGRRTHLGGDGSDHDPVWVDLTL